jgi:4-hydroxy-2-oxoheptanedioate aldolase
MIPHVTTPEKAQQLVEAVKFPPIGDRGLDNAAMDSGWRATDDTQAYTNWANTETFLTVQIETPEAVDKAEEIASIEGVDMIFVGPGDLGLRYQQMGDTDGSMLEAGFERVAAACAKHGKPWACPASGDAVKHRYDQGARVLANFGEYMALKDGLLKAVKEFDGLG